MPSNLFTKKAAAFLNYAARGCAIILTNKNTCNDLRKHFDLSRTEFEKITDALSRSGYAEIIQDGSLVVLVVTEQGKSVAAGSDPFIIREGGISDGS